VSFGSRPVGPRSFGFINASKSSPETVNRAKMPDTNRQKISARPAESCGGETFEETEFRPKLVGSQVFAVDMLGRW
jgi:hypothetical protein